MLQEQGRLSKKALASEIGLSPSACLERLKRLEDLRVIVGYRAELDIERLGQLQTFHTHIVLRSHRAASFRAFEGFVQNESLITNCVALGGGIDYTMTSVAPSVVLYQDMIDTMLEAEIGIERYHTYIETKSIKRRALTMDDLTALRDR